MTRAELILHGCAVFDPSPLHVLPPVDEHGVREVARAELLGYRTWAAWRCPGCGSTLRWPTWG